MRENRQRTLCERYVKRIVIMPERICTHTQPSQVSVPCVAKYRMYNVCLPNITYANVPVDIIQESQVIK